MNVADNVRRRMHWEDGLQKEGFRVDPEGHGWPNRGGQQRAVEFSLSYTSCLSLAALNWSGGQSVYSCRLLGCRNQSLYPCLKVAVTCEVWGQLLVTTNDYSNKMSVLIVLLSFVLKHSCFHLSEETERDFLATGPLLQGSKQVRLKPGLRTGNTSWVLHAGGRDPITLNHHLLPPTCTLAS